MLYGPESGKFFLADLRRGSGHLSQHLQESSGCLPRQPLRSPPQMSFLQRGLTLRKTTINTSIPRARNSQFQQMRTRTDALLSGCLSTQLLESLAVGCGTTRKQEVAGWIKELHRGIGGGELVVVVHLDFLGDFLGFHQRAIHGNKGQTSCTIRMVGRVTPNTVSGPPICGEEQWVSRSFRHRPAPCEGKKRLKRSSDG
jgi:hypothetical protein